MFAKRRFALFVLLMLALGAFAASCGSPQTAEPASRLFAVHNALRAMGLTEVGPIHQGRLAEGQEAKLPLSLSATCVTLMAFGGQATKDLSLVLVDPLGKVVAESDTHESQASVRTCVDQPGAYTMVVRMASGAGDFVAGSWTGGERAPGADGGALALSFGGSCENPTPIVPGQTYAGSTDGARAEQQGSCGNSNNDAGKEAVFRFDAATRQRVTIELAAQFDSVLYLRKGDCADDAAEIACNDDAPGGTKGSRIDTVVDPGVYFVFVDAYGDDSGAFRLQLSARDAPALNDVCRSARPLSAGAHLMARVEDGFDNVHAACGRGGRGPDVAYRFDLPTCARVRLSEVSSDFRTVLHVRRACEDESTEIVCADSGLSEEEASWVGFLDQGAYWVFADGADEGATGGVAVAAETAAATGGGTQGDTCGDALSLNGVSGRLEGDTFDAKDDFTLTCAAPGAPDVVYRLDVGRRSRITARFLRDEARHVVALTRACGDRAGEFGCGSSVDRVVPAGTYFLAVDAERENSLGRYTLAYRVRDLDAIDSACAKAPLLVPGRAQSSTTTGAGDRFSPGCAQRGAGRAAPDRVYRFALAKRTALRLGVTGQGFAPAVSVRRACADDATEIKCSEATDDNGQVQLQLVLEAGAYYAVVDGASQRGDGAYTIVLDELK